VKGEIMNTRISFTSRGRRHGARFILAALLAPAGALGSALQAQRAQPFPAPDSAMQAVIKAAKAKDAVALDKIFGPDSRLLLSGDPVEDAKDFDDFTSAVQQSSRLRKDSDAKYTMVVGDNQYPFPIPIVKAGPDWAFDTRAGAEEMLNRRIGENELSAIASCRAYVVAQWEYFSEGDRDNDGVAEYAQQLVSSSGRHDGLYWPTDEGAPLSPLGALVAAARAEGYTTVGDARDSAANRVPYHGYYFKILTSQSAYAPGGKHDYVINGNMIAGHALVAYPHEWGKSGVMTFIVNQQGRVYERNLGANTAKLAGAMTVYNPSSGWTLVRE
jgi:hypothetical protein